MRRHGRDFLRYASVGVLATAAHYALLAALVEGLQWSAPLSAALGAALGAQVAFVGNRWFTFAHRGPWRAAWWRFQATAMLGAAVSASAVAVGEAVALHYLAAQVVGTLLALVLTYSVNRAWSFGHRPTP